MWKGDVLPGPDIANGIQLDPAPLSVGGCIIQGAELKREMCAGNLFKT